MERPNFIFCSSLFLLMGVAAVVSDFIPALSFAFGARLLLVPAIFLACALTVRFPLMLAFAFVAGVGWDARHMVVDEGGGVGFGYSVFLFALTGALMQGVRPLFRRGRWEFPLLLVGAATAILLVTEWFLISFQRGSFTWPSQFWYQVWTSTLLCILISPLLFFLLFKLGKASGAPVHLSREISRDHS